MNALVTLAASTGPQDRRASAVRVRPVEAVDVTELSDLYRLAYAGGAAHPDSESDGGFGVLLRGVYGSPVAGASLVSINDDGKITAAIITTAGTTAADGAAAAFIAELFTHPEHRRQGLAEELLVRCLQALHDAGRTSVAVRVDSSNAAAMALYLSRDFQRLPDDEDD